MSTQQHTASVVVGPEFIRGISVLSFCEPATKKGWAVVCGGWEPRVSQVSLSWLRQG